MVTCRKESFGRAIWELLKCKVPVITNKRSAHGLYVSKSSVENIISHGNLACLAYGGSVQGSTVLAGYIHTMSTSNRTFPFDSVAMSLCFFKA